MSKHTPGEWTVHAIWTNSPCIENGGVFEVEEAHYDVKERLQEGCDVERVIEANARLISAAPDLLEALQRLLRANEADYEHLPDMDVRTSFETNSMAVNQARAAIAKATGADP